MDDKRYIIIGWGLAGATLAWHYHKRGIAIQVYDSGKNDSTRTAAGLVNPIVFKRLTKSWKADLLLPYARTFYNEIEAQIKSNLISNRDILRIFASIEEQNNWSSIRGDDRFENYLMPIENIELKGIQAPHGAGRVKTIGNLSTSAYLDESKKYLSTKTVEFKNEKFDYYNVNEKDQFIFCEGFEVENNFFFNYLPMKPSQGETLTIKTEELDFTEIINKNMFVLPLGDGKFKIGSTYNWEINTSDPTPFGEKELRQKLAAFADFNYDVIDHKAGIRPTVSDRRPLIGTHPENSNLHIFNGLGTKGVMIAPYFANHFLEYLIDGRTLDSEVNIDRYRKHFND